MRRPIKPTEARLRVQEALAMLRRANSGSKSTNINGDASVNADFSIGYAKAALTRALFALGENSDNLCMKCSLKSPGVHQDWCTDNVSLERIQHEKALDKAVTATKARNASVPAEIIEAEIEEAINAIRAKK